MAFCAAVSANVMLLVKVVYAKWKTTVPPVISRSNMTARLLVAPIET